MPSAELLYALVEHSSDVILLLSAEGRILYASQSNERVLGYPIAQPLAGSVFELIHPDDAATVRRRFAEALAHPGRPTVLSFRVRHYDGSWRDIEAVAVSRLDNAAVGGVVVNYRDVTGRVRIQAALARSEGRYRHLVEHASDIIYRCDAHGRCTFVNPNGARIMQYRQDELVGRDFLRLVREDFREPARAFYQKQLADRTPTTYFEFPAIAKDGTEIWFGQNAQLVIEDGKVVAVDAIARDITDRRRAEDALRRSEARYRSLIHGALYGIYRVTFDGRFLDMNPAMAAMLGYDSPAELIDGHNARDLYQDPRQRAELINRHRQRPFAGVEVGWRRKDGSPITVRLSGRVVETPDEEPHIEAIVENVTERRLLEEQLRQSQKMEAIGQLARGVAHDFNNLLATVMGSSELLLVQLPEGDRRRIEAEEILHAAQRGAALTRQLLAFSRRQTADPRVLDLTAVVRNLESMLRRLIRPEIELEIVYDERPVFTRADLGHIEQIVMNLVINARDAMPEGGRMRIEVSAVEIAEVSALVGSGREPGRFARLSVSDTGTGIDTPAQSRIFEPFYSTKDPAMGTGLGLSIVYGIVQQAGGTISVTSQVEQGSTFEIDLPLIESYDGEAAAGLTSNAR